MSGFSVDQDAGASSAAVLRSTGDPGKASPIREQVPLPAAPGRSSGHSGGSARVLAAGISAVTPSHAAKIVALERHRRDRGDLDRRAENRQSATLLRKWNAPEGGS